MAEVRYGHVEGPGKGREIPTAADQYFHRRGGKFVKLVAGNVTLCATGDAVVYGWANTPKHAEGYDAWKSSATAEADSVYVIYGVDDVFELPVDEANASLAASYIGQGAALVNSGSTYTTVQKAKIGGSVTASPVYIVDVDTDNKTVKVKIKAGQKQAN